MSTPVTPSRTPRRIATAAGLLVALTATAPLGSQQPRFFRDDPIAIEPETQDASAVRPWNIDLAYDLAHAYLVTARQAPSGERAGNVNTIDEVPDSSWFTNRIGARPLSAAEIATGPVAAPPPDPTAWTVLREKSSGAAPGFTARDARGATWFLSFDTPSTPEGATGGLVVANRLFWALGYHQVEYHLSALRRDRLTIDPAATVRRPSGRRTRMTEDDLAEVLARARPGDDGAYRVAAGLALPGRILGGFRYEGTRPDDPNDLVPHEHRRELRALRVFAAWTNLTDLKAATRSTPS